MNSENPASMVIYALKMYHLIIQTSDGSEERKVLSIRVVRFVSFLLPEEFENKTGGKREERKKCWMKASECGKERGSDRERAAENQYKYHLWVGGEIILSTQGRPSKVERKKRIKQSQ